MALLQGFSRSIGLLLLGSAIHLHAQDLQWQRALTTNVVGNDLAYLGGIASNATGRLAIAGQFLTSASLGSQSLTNGPGGGADGYLFVTDPTGALLWHKQFAGEWMYCSQPEVDAAGNVYVAVSGSGASYTFNGGAAGTQTWSDRYAVIKFDPLGNLVQRTVLTASALPLADSHEQFKLVAGPTGELFVMGSFSYSSTLVVQGPGSSLTLNHPTVNSVPTPFIVKLHANGDPAWGHAFYGEQFLFFRGMDVDDAGNVYIGGILPMYEPGIDLDPSPAVFKPYVGIGQDGFVLKLDASGTFQWAKHLDASSSFLFVRGLACGAGSIYLSGDFAGQADLDPGPATQLHTSTHDFDAFVLALDADGAFQWAHQFSGDQQQRSNWIGVDAAGDVYCAGVFQNTMRFSTLPAAFTAVDYDHFVVKLSAAGGLRWLVTLPFQSTLYLPPDACYASGGSPYLYALPPVTETADVDFGPGVQSVAPVPGNTVRALVQYGGTTIVGCMDPASSNYAPTAVVDNGTCTFPGCTDPGAINYAPTATWNDGTCRYLDPACRSDLNADGVVNVTDFGIFTSEYGRVCP